MNTKNYLTNFQKSIDRLENESCESEVTGFINRNKKELEKIIDIINCTVLNYEGCINTKKKLPARQDYLRLKKEKEKETNNEENSWNFLFLENQEEFYENYKKIRDGHIRKKTQDLDFTILNYNHENFLKTKKNIELIKDHIFEDQWIIMNLEDYNKIKSETNIKFDFDFYSDIRSKKIINRCEEPNKFTLEGLIIGPVNIEDKKYKLNIEYTKTIFKKKGTFKKKEYIHTITQNFEILNELENNSEIYEKINKDDYKQLFDYIIKIKENRELILDQELIFYLRTNIQSLYKKIDSYDKEVMYESEIFKVQEKQSEISKLKQYLVRANVDGTQGLKKRWNEIYDKLESKKKELEKISLEEVENPNNNVDDWKKEILIKKPHSSYIKKKEKNENKKENIIQIYEHFSEKRNLEGLENLIYEFGKEIEKTNEHPDFLKITKKKYLFDKNEMNCPQEIYENKKKVIEPHEILEDFYLTIGKYRYLKLSEDEFKLENRYEDLDSQLNTLKIKSSDLYDDRKQKNKPIDNKIIFILDQITRYLIKIKKETKINIYLEDTNNSGKITLWTQDLYISENEHRNFYKECRYFMNHTTLNNEKIKIYSQERNNERYFGFSSDLIV
jgi:hypothetical protein